MPVTVLSGLVYSRYNCLEMDLDAGRAWGEGSVVDATDKKSGITLVLLERLSA